MTEDEWEARSRWFGAAGFPNRGEVVRKEARDKLLKLFDMLADGMDDNINDGADPPKDAHDMLGQFFSLCEEPDYGWSEYLNDLEQEGK